MQQVEPAFNMSIAWGAIFVLVLAVIGGFLAIRHLFGGKGVAIASLLVLGVGVLGLMSFGVAVRRQAAIPGYESVTVVPALSGDPLATTPTGPQPPATPGATTPPGPAPSKIQHVAGNSAPIEIPERPTWLKTPVSEGSLESGYGQYVLTSQQFATVDEAEAELFKTLTTDVQSGFAYHHPSTIGWVPTPEDIRVSGLIAEKVIETIPLKVGEHDATVQRVSWLIEFKPEANKALHARWYPLEAARRSKLYLSLLAGASALFGVSALALRRKSAPPAPVAPSSMPTASESV